MLNIELTNKQYRMLLKLVSLGVDVIDNAALGADHDGEEESDEDTGSPLLDEAAELEGYLMTEAKRFGVTDVVQYDMDEDYLEYSDMFRAEQEVITQSAYLNKSAEIASFQLGLRDYKKEYGDDQIKNIALQDGVEKIMPFSMKYLNEIFEHGFEKFYLNSEETGKIISLSSE